MRALFRRPHASPPTGLAEPFLTAAVARAGGGTLAAEDMLEALRSIDCLGARILAARAT